MEGQALWSMGMDNNCRMEVYGRLQGLYLRSVVVADETLLSRSCGFGVTKKRMKK